VEIAAIADRLELLQEQRRPTKDQQPWQAPRISQTPP
jgi:hypothetical protein